MKQSVGSGGWPLVVVTAPLPRCMSAERTANKPAACVLAVTMIKPVDTHCCRMSTAIKHPLPDRVKPSFVIFDIWAL